MKEAASEIKFKNIPVGENLNPWRYEYLADAMNDAKMYVLYATGDQIGVITSSEIQAEDGRLYYECYKFVHRGPTISQTGRKLPAYKVTQKFRFYKEDINRLISINAISLTQDNNEIVDLMYSKDTVTWTPMVKPV